MAAVVVGGVDGDVAVPVRPLVGVEVAEGMKDLVDDGARHCA